jgi:hypothetical protein
MREGCVEALPRKRNRLKQYPFFAIRDLLRQDDVKTVRYDKSNSLRHLLTVRIIAFNGITIVIASAALELNWTRTATVSRAKP